MSKGRILPKIWDNFPEARKQRIKALAEELEMEYLTLAVAQSHF